MLIKGNIVSYITTYYYVVTAEAATANVSAGLAEVVVTQCTGLRVLGAVRRRRVYRCGYSRPG